MFPSLQLQVSGLDQAAHYSLLVEFHLASPHKYKYKTSWEPVGDAERPIAHPAARLYSHPAGHALGSFWTGQTLHLNKIKLANAFVEGTILLNSMHKYIPRIHLIKNSPQPSTHWETPLSRAIFAFPITEFIAVTAYANDKITQLKIENNPFAKGFRSDGNYAKRKLKAKSADNQEPDCKRRRVSEEINVVDLDESEEAQTGETLHNALSRLESPDMSNDSQDDVFQVKPENNSFERETILQRVSRAGSERVPEHQVSNGKEIPNHKEILPVSSDVMKRLEERVIRSPKTSKCYANNSENHSESPKTSKCSANNSEESDKVQQHKQSRQPVKERTLNAAMRTLNNITNQVPNIQICHECKRIRTQFYRPWEMDRMCNCRRTESNSERSSNADERSSNASERNSYASERSSNASGRNGVDTKENSVDRFVGTKENTMEKSRVNPSFNMSRILDDIRTNAIENVQNNRAIENAIDVRTNASPNTPNFSLVESTSSLSHIYSPQYYPIPSYNTYMCSNQIQRGNACYFGKIEETRPLPPYYALEMNAIRVNQSEDSDVECREFKQKTFENGSETAPFERLNESQDDGLDEEISYEGAMRNSQLEESSHEEEQALDFSIREEVVEPARSPSNYSTVSSSSGYESRNSSSSELQSPPASPQYKYDRYYSLPNISIVSSLF
ncbi:hypothetical protein M8J75_015178 [Diaphorina citri]|nr:hypothetical protein M8J75_015178 [Diaphorina citri]